MNTTKRSPFTLDAYESGIAIIACVATSLILYFILKNERPFGYENISMDWSKTGGSAFFSLYVVPLALVLAISSVSLLRAIRHEEIRYLSRLINIAIALPPLPSFLPLNTLSFFSLYFLCFGFLFSVVVIFVSVQGTNDLDKIKGNWFALLWNIVWVVFAYSYFDLWWAYFGD